MQHNIETLFTICEEAASIPELSRREGCLFFCTAPFVLFERNKYVILALKLSGDLFRLDNGDKCRSFVYFVVGVN